VVLVGLTATLLSGAGGRRKLWDLDLSKLVKHQTDPAAQVWGIRYSPDESKIAIGFGPRWNFDPRPAHVVIVSVDHPQTKLQEFELNTNKPPYPSGRSIVWSPSGTALILKNQMPIMLRLGQEAPCYFSED
jgi:hypothetical protein